MKCKTNLYDENQNEDDFDEPSFEDDYVGYTVTDENGAEIFKKGKDDDKDDEPTIATPIPENEQTVIIDNAVLSGLECGDKLSLQLSRDSGLILYNKEKVGELKPAFLTKLFDTRKDYFVTCELYSKTPPMIKLFFTNKEAPNSIKIKK